MKIILLFITIMLVGCNNYNYDVLSNYECTNSQMEKAVKETQDYISLMDNREPDVGKVGNEYVTEVYVMAIQRNCFRSTPDSIANRNKTSN